MWDVVMPRLDPAMETGVILRWYKKEGESVEKGEPIALAEGEKTTFDIEAPASGILSRIIHHEESEVPVADKIAIVSIPGEPVPTTTRPRGRVAISPAARRLARKHSIDYADLTGSGPGGRIVKADIEREVSRRKEEAETEPGTVPKVRERIPLKGTRKTIADRLGRSHRTTAPVNLVVEVDMEEILALREETKCQGDAVSTTAFVVKAAAKTLEVHPTMNSSLIGDEIRIYEDINIAVAVHRTTGLVAPVIHASNEMSLQEISNAIRDLSEKAKEETLERDDLTGGTFTVSNLGETGVDVFAPVINPPQTGILGMGSIAKRPTVVEGEMAVRRTCMLSLVFDHRVLDGVPAAEFLSHVKGLLENPQKLVD